MIYIFRRLENLKTGEAGIAGNAPVAHIAIRQSKPAF